MIYFPENVLFQTLNKLKEKILVHVYSKISFYNDNKILEKDLQKALSLRSKHLG